MKNLHICSFSGNASELKFPNRTLKKLLFCLSHDGYVSCFDMSEYKWLRALISDAKKSGLITETIDLILGLDLILLTKARIL